METDQLNDALDLFAATSPQYGRLGLSNHGPMVSEVLAHLGRAEAIGGWAATYAERLSPAPPPAAPLSEEAWPGALGEYDRFPEWLGLFEREIADRPVAAVVGEWVPRLVPGTVGAATHGLIRTEFEQAVSSLGPGGRALTLLDALAVGGAKAYLQNASTTNPIALIPAVTGPLALELVLPWLAAEDRDAALAYAWQAVAAIHVAYATDRHLPEVEVDAVPSEDDLVERALASGDEHALKLTEAALRSYGRTKEPALLAAAADASARLGGG
jgi:hypothetical protein